MPRAAARPHASRTPCVSRLLRSPSLCAAQLLDENSMMIMTILELQNLGKLLEVTQCVRRPSREARNAHAPPAALHAGCRRGCSRTSCSSPPSPTRAQKCRPLRRPQCRRLLLLRRPPRRDEGCATQGWTGSTRLVVCAFSVCHDTASAPPASTRLAPRASPRAAAPCPCLPPQRPPQARVPRPAARPRSGAARWPRNPRVPYDVRAQSAPARALQTVYRSLALRSSLIASSCSM